MSLPCKSHSTFHETNEFLHYNVRGEEEIEEIEERERIEDRG